MIVVTGASRGLGRSISERLASKGYEICGVARTVFPASFELASVDVASEAQVREFARAIRDRGIPVTCLINAAGVAAMNLALMAPPATVRSLVATNLFGTMFMCQSIAPLMIRAGGGSIINFSTIAVSLALAGESAYVASKAGVEAYSRTLARELARHSISVNCIAPGPIDTELLRGVSAEQRSSVVGQQIIQRQFEAQDVCDVVELMIDPRSRSLTGHVLHIGGV